MQNGFNINSIFQNFYGILQGLAQKIPKLYPKWTLPKSQKFRFFFARLDCISCFALGVAHGSVLLGSICASEFPCRFYAMIYKQDRFCTHIYIRIIYIPIFIFLFCLKEVQHSSLYFMYKLDGTQLFAFAGISLYVIENTILDWVRGSWNMHPTETFNGSSMHL